MVPRTSTQAVRALVSRQRPTSLPEALERLGELELSLLESEDRAKATFEQASIGIAHQTLDQQWLWVNQRWCDILGYPTTEMLDLTLEQITHPADLAASVAFAERARAGGLPEYTIDKRYIRKNGSTVWVHLTVSMIHPPSGAPSYYVGFIEDITARRRTEQRLAAQYAVTRLLGESSLTD